MDGKIFKSGKKERIQKYPDMCSGALENSPKKIRALIGLKSCFYNSVTHQHGSRAVKIFLQTSGLKGNKQLKFYQVGFCLFSFSNLHFTYTAFI